MSDNVIYADFSTFQSRSYNWCKETFVDEIVHSEDERQNRFFEEACELVQATGMPKEKAIELIDYVYSREPGKIGQEVGGVTVTLAMLCQIFGVDLIEAAETEYQRIMKNQDKIRAKQQAKPRAVARAQF